MSAVPHNFFVLCDKAINFNIFPSSATLGMQGQHIDAGFQENFTFQRILPYFYCRPLSRRVSCLNVSYPNVFPSPSDH